MRENEMRERVERILRVWGSGPLVTALGIGLTIGGCATAPARVEAVPQVVAIYSAPAFDEPSEQDPPKPEAESQEFDPTLDLP